MAKTKTLIVEQGTVKFEGKYYTCGSVIPDVPKQVADDLIKEGLCRVAGKEDLEPTDLDQEDSGDQDHSIEEHSQEKVN